MIFAEVVGVRLLGRVSASMDLLIGGVDATGRVDAADVSLVRQQTLRSATRSNFREDVNTSGRVDAADVSHRPAANVDLLNGAAGAATSEASG
jgi:hypothetical protein